MGNIETIQQIYAAFGRGDIPAVLGNLDENVEVMLYGVRETSPRYRHPKAILAVMR